MDKEEFEEKVLNEFEGDSKLDKFSNLLATVNEWKIYGDETVDEMMVDFGNGGGLFFFNSNKSPVSDVNLIRAFMEVSEDIHLDEIMLEDRFDEVNAENAGKLLEEELNHLLGFNFEKNMKDAFIKKVKQE